MNLFKNIFKKKNRTKKNVFIVEDNEAYAKLLQTFIHIRFPEIEEIKIFSTGEIFLTALHHNPFIVIVDYFLDSKNKHAVNGLEIIKRIKVQKPETNIIVLSEQEILGVAVEAIEQYDCIYVQKDQEAFNKVEQFIKAIYILKNH